MKYIISIAIFFASYSILFSYSQMVSDSSRINEITRLIDAIEDDHCEVPCGIYGDSLRIALIDEHIRTVEKSMKQVIEISDDEKPNYNQLIRWVVNKDDHANKIQHIVSQYFLHQRIKPVDMANEELAKRYQKQLMYLHHILVYATKSKQSTDLENIAKLKVAVEQFEQIYFHKHEH